MNAASILLLAFAMSTDAFAAAVGKGSALLKPRWDWRHLRCHRSHHTLGRLGAGLCGFRLRQGLGPLDRLRAASGARWKNVDRGNQSA